MKAFLELISLLVLIAAGITFVAGSLNQLFDWNLALQIGGSTIPLPEDFVGVVAVAIALALLSGLCFLLADLKRPLRFLGQYRMASLGGLAVAIALLIIGAPRVLPNLFLELAVQGNDSAKAQAMLEQRSYPPAVLSELTYWSLKHEDYALTEMMFEQGADINHRRGEFESTLLHDAVNFFAPAATDFLLDRGIDPNAQDTLGRTALHVLITYRANHMVGMAEPEILSLAKSLVAAGADATLTDESDQTAIALADSKGYDTVVQFLRTP
ncbi:MAG: ankyrin repeat domain-containing protein [Leptolyngbyaceae cyanobacterium]